MLYNQSTGKQREVSAADFIAWLESHDPNETYDFANNTGHCLIGQYNATHGLKWFKGHYRESMDLIFGCYHTPQSRVLAAQPQTFGGALKRTKEYLYV